MIILGLICVGVNPCGSFCRLPEKGRFSFFDLGFMTLSRIFHLYQTNRS